MININKAFIQGRLGADAEKRSLADGKPVVRLRVATSEFWRDKQSGERKESTEWHDVVIFNEHLCDLAERNGKKGREVYVEGQMQARKWTDNKGIERRVTEVVLQNFRGQIQFGPLPSSDTDDQEAEENGGGFGELDEIPF